MSLLTKDLIFYTIKNLITITLKDIISITESIKMPLIRIYHPSPRTFTDAKERKALSDAVCAFF